MHEGNLLVSSGFLSANLQHRSKALLILVEFFQQVRFYQDFFIVFQQFEERVVFLSLGI